MFVCLFVCWKIKLLTDPEFVSKILRWEVYINWKHFESKQTWWNRWDQEQKYFLIRFVKISLWVVWMSWMKKQNYLFTMTERKNINCAKYAFQCFGPRLWVITQLLPCTGLLEQRWTKSSSVSRRVQHLPSQTIFL